MRKRRNPVGLGLSLVIIGDTGTQTVETIMQPRSMKLDRTFRFRALALVASAVLFAVPVAQAANCTWNTTTGNWATPGDWTSCGVAAPGTSDFATIGTTGVVTVNTGQAAGAIGNAGAINIDAFTLTISGNANGGASTNSGTITAGSLLTGSLLMFNTTLNNTGGNIVVNGAGSFLNQFGATISGGVVTGDIDIAGNTCLGARGRSAAFDTFVCHFPERRITIAWTGNATRVPVDAMLDETLRLVFEKGRKPPKTVAAE